MSRRAIAALLLALVVALGVLSAPAQAARDISTSNALGAPNNGAGVTEPPVTISVWANPDSVTGTRVYAVVDNGSNTSGFRLFGNGTSLSANAQGTEGNNSATAGTLSTGSWQHLGAVFGSVSSRYAYLNGVPGSEATATMTPSGVDTVMVGSTSAATSPADGRVAHLAVWAAALTDAEMLALAKGAHPYTIRRASLKHYYPLSGDVDPEPDLVGGVNLALVGTPAKADSIPLRGGFGR